MCTPGILECISVLELRAVPTLKSRLHPIFVRECTEAIQKCKNLKRFFCIVPNIMAIFLPSLREKSLEHIRIHANLTTDQAKMLTNFEKLQSLVLESATWNVVDLLPSWAGILQKTLISLTLYVCFYLRLLFTCFFSSSSYNATFRWSMTSTNVSWTQHLLSSQTWSVFISLAVRK